MESVPAENLHTFIHYEIQHLAAVYLRNRTLDRVLLQHLHLVRNLVSRPAAAIAASMFPALRYTIDSTAKI